MIDLPQEDEMDDSRRDGPINRRRFLAVLGGAAGAGVLAHGMSVSLCRARRSLADSGGECRCPACGSDTAEKTVHWAEECPSPEQLLDAWETIGSPGHVTVSQDLMATTNDAEWATSLPKHPLFGTTPKDEGWINACVESGAGFWIRAGASYAEQQKEEMEQRKALLELTSRGH